MIKKSDHEKSIDVNGLRGHNLVVMSRKGIKNPDGHVNTVIDGSNKTSSSYIIYDTLSAHLVHMECTYHGENMHKENRPLINH